jgi:soluble lytic murein transglycosylase-like protein
MIQGAGANSGCGRRISGQQRPFCKAAEPSAKVDALIAACAAENGLPEILLHRVIKRESNYNAAIYHRGHWV